MEPPSKSWCSLKIVFLLILLTITVSLDMFVFQIYTPKFVSSVTALREPLRNYIISFNTFNVSNDEQPQEHSQGPLDSNVGLLPAGMSTRYFRYNSQEYSAALKKLGVERAEEHEFKSKYIATPTVYENDTVIKAPGIRKTKIISLHRVYQHNRWLITEYYHNRDFKRCPYSECEVDLRGKRTDEADLVIFMCKGLIQPPRRPPGQLWALGCYESGVHWGYPNYEIWKDAFNITMSYRFDADFSLPNVQLAWRDRSLLMKEDYYVAMARQKTKTAVWWASNCRRDRVKFVKALQKYIDVDIYGGCGNLKCPRSVNDACRKMLNNTYKFYLGFENSFCKDYVTEKLLKNFEQRVHIVPVLKGGVDYEKHFPPEAIVDGNKFKSAKDLALYLKQLGNDIPRYSKMLQEADKLEAIPQRHLIDWCKICGDLHTKTFGVYKDVKIWSHNNTCKKTEYYST